MIEDKFFSLLYRTNDETITNHNQKNLKLLKAELENIGYKISIKQVSDDIQMIGFYQSDEYDKKAKRNAGRKKKQAKGNVTLSEIRNEITASNANEVAQKYGVSRSTLFRRLKDAEQYGEDFYIF